MIQTLKAIVKLSASMDTTYNMYTNKYQSYYRYTFCHVENNIHEQILSKNIYFVIIIHAEPCQVCLNYITLHHALISHHALGMHSTLAPVQVQCTCLPPTQINHSTDKLVFRFNMLRCDNCHKTISSE